MKRDTVDILCCPTCKSSLTLTIKKEEHNDVIQGHLTCSSCKVNYEIDDGIPNLLPKKPSP